MHGRCSTVNINSDNHNSDLKEDVTCPFNNFLNSTNFVCLLNNAIVFINADITQRNFILRKKSSLFIMFRKGFMKNRSAHFYCNNFYCECKQNITIWEGPRKHNPNTKKISNPESTIIGSETLAKPNKKRNSTFLQTAYPNAFNNEAPLNCSSHIIFNSGSQKSYVIADSKKSLHLKTICNEKIIINTLGLSEGQVSLVDVVNFKIKCRNRQRIC